MPIRQDDNQPNRRFGIVNIILIGVGALLLFSSLFPNQNMQIPRVPYSLFIDQVNIYFSCNFDITLGKSN